jgi:hypothetical protein
METLEFSSADQNKIVLPMAPISPVSKSEENSEPAVGTDFFWDEGGCMLFAASLLRQSLQDYTKGERNKDHRTAKRWIENGNLGGGITFDMCAQMLDLDIDPDHLRARMLQEPVEMLTKLNDYFKYARSNLKEDRVETVVESNESAPEEISEPEPTIHNFRSTNDNRQRG